MKRAATGTLAAALVLAGLTGCGGSSRPDASVCAQALDAADAGFTALGNNVQQVQLALDEAFSGQMQGARVALRDVRRVSATRYKALEAKCRAAVRH